MYQTVEEAFKAYEEDLKPILEAKTLEELQTWFKKHYSNDKFLHKVNLIYGETGINGEGVWAAFFNKDDYDQYMMESNEVFYIALLCNQPIGWGGRVHGGPILVKTTGKTRPVAYPSNQPELDKYHEHIFNLYPKPTEAA